MVSLHVAHRDLSSLEFWRQMANYYRRSGLLKSARSACRHMACAHMAPVRMTCSNTRTTCSNMRMTRPNMRMTCSNRRMTCSNMRMTCSNMHMTCSNMNMVTLRYTCMIVPAYPYRLQLCTSTHPLLGDVFEALYLKMAKNSKPTDCRLFYPRR